MPSRLVSILGLGASQVPPHYTPCAYSGFGEGRISSSTPLVQRALIELDPTVGAVVLLGTAAVYERWVATGLASELLGRPFEFMHLPDGKDPRERWEIFHRLARALRSDRIEDLEDEDPDAIVLDVTHGFRLQPMLGLAALSFVRSDEARDGDPITPVRITYGAFEARAADTNVTPIWDLTELLIAHEWNAAFDAFLKYGRADEVHRLAIDTARQRGGDPAAARSLEAFAKRARRFADDLALSRISTVFKESAEALRHAIRHPELTTWVDRLPVLESPLATLDQRLRRLRSAEVVSKDGLRAQVALIRNQFDAHQFASAAVSIREGLVDLAAVLLNRGHDVEPSESTWTREARKGIEDRLELNAATDRPNPKLESIARFRNQFRRVRNDILHGGRERPAAAPNLREELRRAVSNFETLVKELLG